MDVSTTSHLIVFATIIGEGFSVIVFLGLIENQINSIFLSCHYTTHRNNLAALYTSKAPNYKVISSEIDTILNMIIILFFNMSNKHKYELTTLQ